MNGLRQSPLMLSLSKHRHGITTKGNPMRGAFDRLRLSGNYK